MKEKETTHRITIRSLIRRAFVLLAAHKSPKIEMPLGQIGKVFISFPYHSVGDLILSLTLIDHVHELWPEAELDVAVGERMAPIVDAIPYVNRVFYLPQAQTHRWVPSTYSEISDIRQLYSREIAANAYDVAIAPRWDSRDSFFSGYLAFLTGAPIRCGYSGACDGGTTEVDELLTVAAKGGAGEPESLRYTRLLGRCGLDSRHSGDGGLPSRPIRALQIVAQQRRDAGVRFAPNISGRYGVLSPGATNACRQWPLANFADVGRVLNEKYQMRLLVIGSPQDAELCEELCGMMGDFSVSMAGKTSSLQMLDLIAGADVFIGTDSGPGHIAGALGINTISINAHTDACPSDHPLSPIRWRPVGNRVRLIQPAANLAPCKGFCETNYPHCITQIKVDAVLDAFEELRRL